jgi:Na+-translocating ferredoxin:NAD+ oxidoreductase RnfD subunit
MQADVEAWIEDHALQRLHYGARTKGLCTTNEELRTDVASQKMAALTVALMELAVLLGEVMLAWVEAVCSIDYSMACVSQSILCF